jgi:hypothetical protein
MGDAQKLSVQQLHQSVQDGTLPAYIGIPLIQDKMQQQQMAAASQMPKQPPIAQQIMQAAAPQAMPQQMPQTAPQGVSALQSNLPTEHMAGGGIIAFAGGDLVDDEDEDSVEEAEYQQALSEALSNKEHAGLYSALPEGHKATENRGVGMKPTSSGIGIKDMLAAKAAEHKLPPELLSRIAGVESNYKATAANPNSSAKGLFQFTDATWKGMGGKHGEQFDPEKNAELGARFVRQNAEGLKGALGRNPTYGEVYASHMFGLSGAKNLLNMDPKTPMDRAVSSNVLKANPQLQGKTVGQVMASLNAKTGEGIVALADGGQIDGQMDGGIAMAAPYYGMAAGGSIKHFADPKGDQLVKDDERSAFQQDLIDTFGYSNAANKPPEKPEYLTKAVNYFTKPKANKTAYVPNPNLSLDNRDVGMKESAPKPMPTNQDFKDFDQASALFQAEQANKAPTEVKAEAPKDGFNEFLEDIKTRRAGQAKQKSIDSYMALLQAGLGMMGGTSPHALANIGQGAMSGIQNLSESNKLRAAEQANLDKSQYAALRYKELGDINRSTAAATEAQRRATLGLKTQELSQEQQKIAINQYDTHIKNQLASLDKNPILMADPQAYAAEKAKIINDPVAQALYRRAYGETAPQPDFTGFSVVPPKK